MYDVYEAAAQNYPSPWNKAMLKRLVAKEALTEEEYEAITGESYG